MNAKNENELRAIIIKDIARAAKISASKALADLYEGVGAFYSGGEPTEYERTGALGSTPRVSPVDVKANMVKFKAYLDAGHQYATGKNPTMRAVLELANEGSYGGTDYSPLRPTVGKTGFYDESENKIKEDVDSTFDSFFK